MLKTKKGAERSGRLESAGEAMPYWRRFTWLQRTLCRWAHPELYRTPRGHAGALGMRGL